MDEPLTIAQTKDVWVAWTNTNLTDGYGQEFPLCVCESRETAVRLGAKGGVQGSPCRVERLIAVRVKGCWLVPGRILPEEKADKELRLRREAKEAAFEKARLAGLTDDDLKALL